MIPDRPIVLIGFGKLVLSHLERHATPGTVLVVEDPDILDKRSVPSEAARFACVADVVPARYHQDLQCVAEVRRRVGSSGVLAVLPGLEYGVPAAAALADAFGRPGASPAAAACLTDKVELRRAAALGGLRQPMWREVTGPAEVAEFATDGEYVLKPANRHASLGVQVLGPGDDVGAAWDRAVGARDDMMLPQRELRWRYLVESRVTGVEYSAEAVVADGCVTFLNVTAKSVLTGRHPVELGHLLPAPLPTARHAAVAAAMDRLVAAVGFRTGLLHAEWMLEALGGEPILIECAGRAPGDSIVDLVDLAYGGSLIADVLGVLSGEPPAVRRRPGRAAAVRFLTAPAGRVESVYGLDRARTLPGVARASCSVGAGSLIGELRSSWDRIGEVVAVGPDAVSAAERADRAARAVSVTVATADRAVSA